MKIFIAVDMEGISGVESAHDVIPGLGGYSTFRRVMAGDANAVIDGAIRGGATEVVVADGHAMQTNMLPGDVDPRATLKSGGAGLVQFKGLTPDTDAVILVGFHAKSGTPNGILSHSFLSSFLDLRLNGQSIGEAELGTYLLASYGIPVVMLSGDDTTVGQTRPVIGEQAEYVAVKTAHERMRADHQPLSVTRPALREAAQRAVRRLAEGDIAPVAAPGEQVEMELDLAVAPTDAMPDMLERNARFAEAADARPMNDFEFLRTFEELDSPREGTVRVTGSMEDAYRAISRLCGHFMMRNIDWMSTVMAERIPYSRDLDEWRDDTR
jgi:D-amino peptidase